MNLGAIQTGVPELTTEGIATLQKAIPILVEVDNKRKLCEAYGYLASAYWQNGERTLAMEYLKKLDEQASALKTDVERYYYYQVKALLLQENKQYAEAVTYYHQMTDMLEKGYKDARDYEYYKKLAECYYALKDDMKAYANLRKAYVLRDSTFHLHYQETMSDYSVKYNTKEKELEIVRLQQNELERERELMFRRVIFASIFVVLVLVLLVLLYARQRQKMRLTKLAQAAGEKERQFLTLQKETEGRLTRKYIDGLESERERMATELHDDVCNDLLAFEINISALAEEDGRDLKEQLKFLKAIRERLRSISHELMPPTFQYATLDEMLADYILHLPLSQRTQAEYHSTEGVDWKQVPQEIGFELYRIVQEALCNAIKYAEATHIRVELLLEGKYLSILVADDGKGFDPGRKTKGIGLRTIWQRTKIIGGEMKLDTAPGGGVRIKVSVWI